MVDETKRKSHSCGKTYNIPGKLVEKCFLENLNLGIREH